MDRSSFAPKIRPLTKNESPESFQAWKETILFNLTLDGNFEMFLEEGFTWGPTTLANRGLTSDAEAVPRGKTAKQKAALLNLMLGTIATYTQVIARAYITTDALSLNDIWNRLRIYYGFRKSGGLILDLPVIKLEEEESYEALWERLYAFVTDNLLKQTAYNIYNMMQIIMRK